MSGTGSVGIGVALTHDVPEPEPDAAAAEAFRTTLAQTMSTVAPPTGAQQAASSLPLGRQASQPGAFSPASDEPGTSAALSVHRTAAPSEAVATSTAVPVTRPAGTAMADLPPGDQRSTSTQAYAATPATSAPAMPASAVPTRGAQPPATLPRGAQPPASPPQGAQPPATLPRGAQPPASLPQGAQPPATLPRGAQPPASPPQGAQPPAMPSTPNVPGEAARVQGQQPTLPAETASTPTTAPVSRAPEAAADLPPTASGPASGQPTLSSPPAQNAAPAPPAPATDTATPPSQPDPASSPTVTGPVPAAAPVQAGHAALAATPVIAASAGRPNPADPEQSSRQIELQGHVRLDARPMHHATAQAELALPSLILPATVILRAGRPKRDAPLLRRAPARQPAMLVEDFSEQGRPTRRISFSDRRPVPIDIAPIRGAATTWRLDDTEALVLAGSDQAAAGRRAVTLHGALMGGAGLDALDQGEGFSTWEGSPLWLSLAGITKPAVLGVLLAESAPGRLTVMRLASGVWNLDRPADGPPRAFADADTAFRPTLLYGVGGPAEIAAIPSADPTALRQLEAAAALRRYAAVVERTQPTAKDRAPPSICAAAALASRSLQVCTRELLLDSARAGDLATTAARLHGFGREVLDAVASGTVDGIDKVAGIALAVALGRLNAPRALQNRS